MTPASIRNMNPGAMYPGPSSKRFGSTSFEVLRSKDGVHKIAQAKDLEQRIIALERTVSAITGPILARGAA